MSKLFHQAITLQVKEDTQHKPIFFLYKGGGERVGEILEQWRVTQGWWNLAANTLQNSQCRQDSVALARSNPCQGEVEREYFRVRTEKGIVCELYRDLTTGAWYLQRIYD